MRVLSAHDEHYGTPGFPRPSEFLRARHIIGGTARAVPDKLGMSSDVCLSYVETIRQGHQLQIASSPRLS
jgi:hypothetical protein